MNAWRGFLPIWGKFEDAIAEDSRARLLSGEDQKSVLQKEGTLRRAWSKEGAWGYWGKILELAQLPENPPEMYDAPYGTAILYTHLGEKSKALDLLEEAYEQRSLSMTELAIEPAFDLLRGESRFQNLLRLAGPEKTVVRN